MPAVCGLVPASGTRHAMAVLRDREVIVTVHGALVDQARASLDPDPMCQFCHQPVSVGLLP